MKIVLLIFTLILICLIYRKSLKRDTFSNIIPKSQIEFLSKKQACGVLTNSKKYFEYLNKNDLEARGIIYYNASNISRPTTQSIIKHYCDNVLEFSDDEKDKMSSILNWIYRHLPNKKMVNYFKVWKLAKLDNKIENGYPHTHGDVIFVSQQFVDNIMDDYKTPLDIPNIPNIVDTLIHEKVHVLQRKYPDKFHNLYTKYWNFKKVKEIQNIDNYLDLYRTNPDGLDVYYVFGNKIWLGCFYKKAAHKRMDMVYYYAVPVKPLDNSNNEIYTLDDKQEIEKITSNTEFSNFFDGIYNNYYHPNELAAEAIAKYLTYEMNINRSDNYNKNSPAITKMETWINSEL